MRTNSINSNNIASCPVFCPIPNQMDTTTLKGKGYGLGWRHVVTFLGFFGFFCIYTLRINLSVALVAMVNQTNLHKHNVNSTTCVEQRQIYSNETAEQDVSGTFEWTEETQGFILGAFFYGYITTQIPGGIIASKYGGKWLLGIGVLCTSVFTLFTPIAARSSYGLLIAVRALEGVGEGVTWPAMHALLSRWAPPMERTFLSSVTYTGANVGTVAAFMSAGYLSDSSWGWPSVFYVYGFIGCVWFVLWAILASDSPENHRWISADERDYITQSKKAEGLHTKIKLNEMPLRSILVSPAVWAICVSHFSQNWGFYTLLTELPTYFSNTLGLNIKQNGVLSSVPYIVMSFIQAFAGYLGDLFQTKLNMTTRNVRKLFDCVGHGMPGITLIIVGYVGCNSVLAVALFTITAGASAFHGAGYQVNHLDIAPRYAGFLFGISNTFATIPGFLSPYITGRLINNNQTSSAWRTVFFISTGIYFFSTVFYFIFARGEVQSWALQEDGTTRGYDNKSIEMEPNRASLTKDIDDKKDKF